MVGIDGNWRAAGTVRCWPSGAGGV